MTIHGEFRYYFLMSGEKGKINKKRLAFNRITIDIDGVLADSCDAAVARANKQFHKNFNTEDLVEFGWLERTLAKELGVPQSEVFNLIWSDPEVYRQAPLVTGAKAALEEMLNLGIQISFVTTRAPSLRNVTLDWFGDYLPFVDTGLIRLRQDINVSSEEFKINEIKKLDAQLHIDDSYETAGRLQALGIEVFLVKQNWNQVAPDTLRKSWPEISRYIKVMSHNI